MNLRDIRCGPARVTPDPDAVYRNLKTGRRVRIEWNPDLRVVSVENRMRFLSEFWALYVNERIWEGTDS